MASIRKVRVALVGDFNPTVIAHQAIPLALARAGDDLGVEVQPEWLHTTTLVSDVEQTLAEHRGIWCVPGSPYANTAAALSAIRFAREAPRAFLGTCGGFQHALLEYARNVIGLVDAQHAELAPDAANPLITPLACPLIEQKGPITLLGSSKLAAMYDATSIVEEYHCSYGVAPAAEHLLGDGPLRVTGRDEAGQIRALELEGHPFFVATLFQPERGALRGIIPPIVRGFVSAAAAAH